MGKLFGTDGARGIANETLGCETAVRIGRAAAAVLAHPGRPARVLIGKDTRRSSDMLEAALIAGLCSVGADVVTLGVLPTPAVACLTAEQGADAGIMFSASHNPPAYNGIKLFSREGRKLPDETEDAVEALVLSGEIPLAAPERIGRVTTDADAAERYIERLRGTAALSALDPARPLRIAIDCANGASAVTAPRLFRFPGLEVRFLNAGPDGDHVNEGCGSTHPEALAAFVTGNGLDLGFAFDGDADRCLAVDERGELVDGDRLIALMAADMQARGALRGGAAVTVMSNLGFFRYCEQKGIPTARTKVGDRYIAEEMLRSGKNIGGEQSGHIILSDFSPTGDGQLTALHVLELAGRARRDGNRSFHALASEVQLYPQILVNVRADEWKKAAFRADETLGGALPALERTLHGDGRLLVRVSGTEAVIRVMAEGPSPEETERLAQEAAALIERL